MLPYLRVRNRNVRPVCRPTSSMALSMTSSYSITTRGSMSTSRRRLDSRKPPVGPYFQQAARSAYWLLYRVCCAQHAACSKPRLVRSVTANRLAVWTDKADALAALAARLGDGADASDRVTSPADPKPQVMVRCAVQRLLADIRSLCASAGVLESEGYVARAARQCDHVSAPS